MEKKVQRTFTPQKDVFQQVNSMYKLYSSLLLWKLGSRVMFLKGDADDEVYLKNGLLSFQVFVGGRGEWGALLDNHESSSETH